MNEASALLECVLALVRNNEINKAVEKLNAVRADAAAQSLEARQKSIQAANQSLFLAKRKREEVLAAIAQLPPRERFDAEHMLIPLLDLMFNNEIAQLRSTRRRLASG